MIAQRQRDRGAMHASEVRDVLQRGCRPRGHALHTFGAGVKRNA